MRDNVLKCVDVIGLPRLTVIAFLVLLFAIAGLNGLPIDTLLTNSLTRIAMNGVMVLAMVPSIQAGVGLNFGLPLGVIAGLLGLLVVMEFRIGGLIGMSAALVMAAAIGCLAGYMYGIVLNRVRGQEMMIGTYVGFSAVAGMCIFWLLAPFKNPEMIFVISGQGLRTTLPLSDSLSRLIDKTALIKVFGVEVSGGLFGTYALACWLLTVFFRSRTGVSMRVAGANPAFAASCGVNVEAMGILGTTISTGLAAIGMVLYAQSFGFVQLYLGPLMMAFPAVAAILIGGASTKRATVWQAVLGTVLFQTLLTIALPVTRSVIQGDISEVARLIISSGVILYALTRGEGERR